MPAVQRGGGIARAHELANPEYALEPVSRTFHGRDLFAPAAAHLALGVPIEELGPPIDPDGLARLNLPRPDVSATTIRATILYVDRFGNMQLNVRRHHLREPRIEPGTRVELELAGERYYAVAARTFGDARKGDVILYEDAYRNIAVAINGGNASSMFGVHPGREVRIHTDVLLAGDALAR